MSVPTFNSDALFAAEANARYTHAALAATMPFPTAPPKAPHSYWRYAEADLRKLEKLKSPRRFDASSGPTSPLLSVPGSPAVSPRVALPAHVPQQSHGGAADLHALQTWVRGEVAPLPRGTPERLQALRHAFSELIGQLPAHGPLLAEVKREYEYALDRARAAASHGGGGHGAQAGGGPPLPVSQLQRPLEALHPLQMPAAYYEAQWRRCQSELDLVTSQRQRLRRLVRKLRNTTVEAVHRLHGAGGAGDEGGGRSRWPGEEAAVAELAELEEEADDHAPEADPDRALAHSKAVVSAATEEAVDAEIHRLRDQLRVTEVRVAGGGRIMGKLAASNSEARAKLETQLALLRAIEEPGSELCKTIATLTKLATQQEDQIAVASKLLREPASLDKATLKRLSQAASA